MAEYSLETHQNVELPYCGSSGLAEDTSSEIYRPTFDVVGWIRDDNPRTTPLEYFIGFSQREQGLSAVMQMVKGDVTLKDAEMLMRKGSKNHKTTGSERAYFGDGFQERMGVSTVYLDHRFSDPNFDTLCFSRLNILGRLRDVEPQSLGLDLENPLRLLDTSMALYSSILEKYAEE